MQAAILLMPDPNREALQTLLLFLNEVAANSERNQVNISIKRKRKFTQSPTAELCTIALYPTPPWSAGAGACDQVNKVQTVTVPVHGVLTK